MGHIRLIPPLSLPGRGACYPEALPQLTKEEVTDQGTYIAVGFSSHSIVYRGTWSDREQVCSWQFAYHQQ